MRSFFLLASACVGLLCLGASANAEQPARPNVILIFVDDMGFGDVGFNGATGPKTPHLDQMAREGRQFRDFYVGCAVCSGSRTALLTGTHYQRLSMAPVLFPNSQNGLHPDEVTIADMLVDSGYATTCIGKWHLGHLPPCLPTYQGFQSYYGIPYSNDMWIDRANRLAADCLFREGVTRADVEGGQTLKNRVPLMRDEEIIEYPVDQSTVTKRYTEEAVRFIGEHRDEPFFLYLPHTMVHLPLAVSDAFKNRTGQLIWDAIEEVDWSVGEIVKAVRTNKIEEQTLIIFTSDNGAAVGSSLPLRAKKASVYDGGIREPTVMWWPGKVPADTVCTDVTASIDILPTLAALCNAELPDRPIDGHDIRPLLFGVDGAVSPHETYCLTHGPGTVRSGKWKYYPWREGTEKRRGAPLPDPKPGEPLVQLYDTVADISETTNIANQHPDVVARLQSAWEAHNAELSANKRPAIELERPDGTFPPRPDSRGRLKPLNWRDVRNGKIYPTGAVTRVVGKPFVVHAQLEAISGENLHGVIVAHGGTLTGYSLYIQDQTVTLALRLSDDNLIRASAPLPDAASTVTIDAHVFGDRVELKINEQSPVTSASPGLLQKHPAEDLSVGFDTRMPVDPQSPARKKFNGTLKSLRVTASNAD